ncbi:hypothetical protein ACFWZ2_40730 [Streptomyces sp. NPDC059002]|uniref:hypothetical protein n=1 Tax=Streptomyces sp. NPDC059002 TaxID=3346690 RepID=UPI0036CF58C1
MATTRGRTGHGQLLLLAALLFGIVTMHTLGHPSGGHESGPTGAATATGASAAMAHEMGAAPVAHGPGRGADGDGDRVLRVASPVPEPHDGMAMDPLSVCLAVLGAFTLALLVRAGLLRPGGTLARFPGPGRLLHALRPQPPPPRTLLSRLSVLRI